MTAVRVCAALAWVACMLVPGAGCSGTPAQAPLRPALPETSAPAAGITVALYRDGAVVRDRRLLAIPAGSSTVVLDSVAHSLIGASPTLASLSEPTSMRARALLTPARASGGQAGLAALIGREVTAYGSDGSVTGVLRAVEGHAGQPLSGQGVTALVEIRSDERQVKRVPGVRWIDAPAAAWSRSAPGRLAWTVEAARAGTQLVEAMYTTDALPWRARYTLVVDGQDWARESRLHGWLELENRMGVALEGAQVRVSDRALPSSGQDGSRPGGQDGGRLGGQDGGRPAGQDGGRPSGQDGGRLGGQDGGRLGGQDGGRLGGQDGGQPRGQDRPLLSLAAPVDLAAGASTSRLFVDVRAPRLDEVLVYDPIGTSLNHGQAQPIWARSYGTRAGTEVYRSLRLFPSGLDHAAALPAGELLMLQRDAAGVATVVSQGRLEAVHLPDGMVFLKADLGVAAEVQGQRQQREYSYDPRARRLVEEIGVTVHNHGDRRVTVVVNEHLYRSLSWTIAYHNAVGDPRKAGPQQIYFTVSLAAGERAFIIYRVVYTW